jgi:hypothetical protein
LERDLNAGWDQDERPRRLARIAARTAKLPPDLRTEIQRRLRRLAGPARASERARRGSWSQSTGVRS